MSSKPCLAGRPWFEAVVASSTRADPPGLGLTSSPKFDRFFRANKRSSSVEAEPAFKRDSVESPATFFADGHG